MHSIVEMPQILTTHTTCSVRRFLDGVSGTRHQCCRLVKVPSSDQFCSLVFTLSNLYFIPCTYTVGFDDWRQCTTSTKNWPVMFIVGTLPLTIRVVQSIKRYYDSRLVTHLVNVRLAFVPLRP